VKKMSAQPSACPNCGSTEIHHRKTRGYWSCDACDHKWTPTNSPLPSTEAKSAPRVRLFLSYGRRDAKELADRLKRDLEGRGYEVWQDTREIRSGTEWELEMEDGLRST
jgi:TIR domain